MKRILLLAAVLLGIGRAGAEELIGLKAVAHALTDKVRVGEPFKVELRLENHTPTTRFLNVNVNPFPLWRPDTLEVSVAKWGAKDDGLLATIGPGAAKVRMVEMVIPHQTPHRHFTFKMGFAQPAHLHGKVEEWWDIATAWSNEVSVEVVGPNVGPVAIARASADFDHDGRIDELSLLWQGGRHFDDEDIWCGAGERYEGEFAFRVAFADGRVADTPFSALGLNQGIWFRSGDEDKPESIVTADYNHDGTIDFNIGQYAGCNGSNFYLFEVPPSGKIAPLLDDNGGSIYSHHALSSDFELTDTGFVFSNYDNTRGRGVSYRADWDAGARRFHVAEIPGEPSAEDNLPHAALVLPP